MTPSTLAAVAFTALAAAAARPGQAQADDDVRASLAVHGRFTDRENTPSPTLLFDRSARTFDLAAYLRPQGSDSYASTPSSAPDGSASRSATASSTTTTARAWS
ncbi:MAG TPA: hypothetical protein VF341_13955 [Anaeromyxobacteraceae bacterium]